MAAGISINIFVKVKGRTAARICIPLNARIWKDCVRQAFSWKTKHKPAMKSIWCRQHEMSFRRICWGSLSRLQLIPNALRQGKDWVPLKGSKKGWPPARTGKNEIASLGIQMRASRILLLSGDVSWGSTPSAANLLAAGCRGVNSAKSFARDSQPQTREPTPLPAAPWGNQWAQGPLCICVRRP